MNHGKRNASSIRKPPMKNLSKGRTSFRARHSNKLSWEQTATEMSGESELWCDFERTVSDGLNSTAHGFSIVAAQWQ